MDDLSLIKLANVALQNVRPRYSRIGIDRDDCYQVAYCAGLTAKRTCERRLQNPSARYLILCMQTAIMRLLHNNTVDDRQPMSDLPETKDHFGGVEASDYLKARMGYLTDKQARTLIAYFNGESTKAIALSEGIKYKAVWHRINAALKKLRLTDEAQN